MRKFRSKLLDTIAPPHIKGKDSLTVSSKTAASETYAHTMFNEASQRLLDVNHWQRYAGKATAHFQLIDSAGNEVHREARESDYFQIDIPGPGLETGRGNDWVLVHKIGHEKTATEEIKWMTVRPASHPLSLKKETAHFFEGKASSTFFIHLKGMQVTAGVFGRNETPNVETSSIADRLRNFFVAIGAMLGLSKVQWKALTLGLVNFSARQHI